MIKLLATITVIALCGCSRRATQYTEDDVRAFVQPGTSRDAIIKRFGEPIVDEKNPKFDDGSTAIDEIIYFNLPSPNPPVQENWAFAGFQVRLKNGKAVQWMASHRDTHVGR